MCKLFLGMLHFLVSSKRKVVLFMEKDITKKLQNVLNGIDKNTINQSKKNIEQFLSTPEGHKLAAKLSSVDKSKVLDSFMSMDSEEIKHKLKNADLSKISQASEILKKMR